MPVYNGERYLRLALDALLAQTYRDFTVVISDNASTDGTPAICREYADRDPRVRYVRQSENLGAAGNINALIELSSSPLFSSCRPARPPRRRRSRCRPRPRPRRRWSRSRSGI